MDLIITGANSLHFHFLELFVTSLRTNGQFRGKIVVCDNSISGEWDNPSKLLEISSFSENQVSFLKEYNVKIILYHELIRENNISRNEIDSIPSYTQRYPHKYIYTTLISKRYLNKVDTISFFDADIYFQKPIQPLLNKISQKGIHIVKEYKKICENPFLKKWITHSDFSLLSSQKIYEKQMLESQNYCTGFFGGNADSFHKLTLLASLLTSNQFIEFYSDQPLMNILKSYFQYPINELSDDYVMHLGELPKEDLVVKNKNVQYKNRTSIAVHFNGDTKDIFEYVSTRKTIKYSSHSRLFIKLKKVLSKCWNILKVKVKNNV